MEVTNRTFAEEVLQSEIPVLVDFWASWCLPCKAIEPVLEELGTEYGGRVKICKMNVDRNKYTAKNFDISGLPTFIIFRNGELVARDVASKSKRELQEMIEENCF